MYLHIGKDLLVNKKDIIGLFNYEKLSKNNNFNYFIKNLEKNIEIVDINNKKSFILIKEREKTKGYISNISTTTLLNRIKKNKKFTTEI